MSAIIRQYGNRGVPPLSFYNAVLAWGATAPDGLFSRNNVTGDVFGWAAPLLGPWQSDLHRRAVLLHIVLVLAGMEASWNWNEGEDQAAVPQRLRLSPAQRAMRAEAGPWQVSYDSIHIDASLPALLMAHGITNAADFQAAMKGNHALALTYIAALLRVTVAANGPLVYHKIDQFLRPDPDDENVIKPAAIREWMTALASAGQ